MINPEYFRAPYFEYCMDSDDFDLPEYPIIWQTA